MTIRPPPKGIGATVKGSSRRWGRNYGNRELFPLFGVSDYESLLVKLAEIGIWPHLDDLNKRAFVVWHKLPDDSSSRLSRSIATIWDRSTVVA